VPCTNRDCESSLHDLQICVQVKTSRTFIRDATVASPLALALFGAGTLDVVHDGGYMALGGWLRFRAPAQVFETPSSTSVAVPLVC
jgi:hypothetical protein